MRGPWPAPESMLTSRVAPPALADVALRLTAPCREAPISLGDPPHPAQPIARDRLLSNRMSVPLFRVTVLVAHMEEDDYVLGV